MDLIQKAINKGFYPNNEKYYLWEIQKWLREKHEIYIYCLPKVINLTFNWQTNYSMREGIHFNTYEEALEEGLLGALKLIKT